MGWRSLVPIRAGQPVEVTTALTVPREARELALVITGPIRSGAHVTGTGFSWSQWLGAPYIYVPPGPAGTAATFHMTFDVAVTGLVVELQRVRERTALPPGAVAGAMMTCYEGELLDIAQSARMERMGHA